MPLNINPIISQVLQPVVNNTLNSIQNAIPASVAAAIGLSSSGKQTVDNLINRLSGGIGSGSLNGTAGNFSIRNTTSNLSQVAQTLANFDNKNLASTASTLGNTVQTLSQLGTTVGSVAGPAPQTARAIEAIASGGLAKSGIASALSAASPANLASNVLQQARAANLPSVGPNFADPDISVRTIPVSAEDWRIRINAPPAVGGGEIVFPVLPNMTLSHRANYTDTALVHTNYLFLAYKMSQTEDITITCEWPVETLDDIAEYIGAVRLGRTLTKMFYGSSPELGNPPPICTIKGYGTGGALLPDTPVVVKQFSVDLKEDVNYVQDGNNNWIPRLSTLTFVVGVVYNRNTQRSFNILDYRLGLGAIRY